MLGWLAVATTPILVHLWSRRRYRVVPWAATEYLMAAVQQRARRRLVEQWLLLTVRTLLIAMVVLAVAEPYIERAGFAYAPGKSVHHVLVFDGSYSMGYKPTEKTRFERAKELARRIVEESPQGDAFSLVLMSSSPHVVVGTPALEPRAVIDEIGALQMPDTIANLPAAITSIRRLMKNARRENPRLTRQKVYFLTDLQRETWAPKLSAADAAEFRRKTEELAQMAALVLIDLGHPQAENLAITNLQTTDPLTMVGHNVPLVVDLKNFGRQSLDAQPVELFVDGRRIQRKTTNVPPGGTASVKFSYRFDSPGDHVIEVSAIGDALEVDNHRFLAVPVRRSVRHILCVDGRPSGRPFHGAADYLAVALAPGDDPTGAATMQADIVTESALLERNLNEYECLFLCNVAQFTASEARVLDTYLQGGGSLVIFLGDRVLADRYNRELGVSGQGRAGGPRILPARVGPVVNQPQFQLDPRDFRHPVLHSFRGRGQASLLKTPVFKYYKLDIPKNSPSKTVLAIANGDPLVVEQPVHRGHVFLIATSAEPAWTAMPLWPSFVPLVREIVSWCAAGRLQQQNITVGQPLEVSMARPNAEIPPSILSPDGRSHPARPHGEGDFTTLSYANTLQSGVYVVRLGPPIDRTQTFAANVDTAESNLTQVDPEELRNEVWPGIPFLHQTSWQDSGETAVGSPNREGTRLHVGLLYAALGLLFLETFLGWKWGYHGGSGKTWNMRKHKPKTPNP